MAAFLPDLRYSFRALGRNPVFAVAAVVTIGLGIGCSTGIFSAFNATVLHPLPYPDAGNIVRVEATSEAAAGAWGSMPLPDALAIQSQKGIFDSAGFYARIDVLSVSSHLFKVLGVRPALGRWLRPDDMQPGNSQVAVISHALWVEHMAGDRNAIGKTIRLDNQPYRVVGAMPERFDFPDPFIQAWIPEPITSADRANRSSYGTPLLARLKLGATLAVAEAALNTLASRIARAYPDTAKGLSFRLIHLQDEVSAPKP